MEKFVVSARKYRPATFDTVVGQSHITTTLKNAIRTNHLAQAFLFCGPRGVGKTTCARILAKTINCQSLEDSIEPCHTCSSCRSFDQNTSFTIHELDAASNNSVEDIRNLIDQVRFPPQDGKYKVYIIDEVHMLSQSAFNAFLKTLEEPPKHAIFILATTEKHKILPTILSRCQIFDFNRIQIKDIADHLASIAVKEKIEADYPALELIAQKAEGGLRDALSMFDLNVTFSGGRGLTYEDVLKNLHILDYDYYFRMTDALFEGSISAVLLLYNEILEKGFDSHQFIVGLNEHFRNLLVAKAPETVKLLEVSPSVQVRYLEQSKKLQTGYLMSCLSVGNHLDIQYKSAKNQRLHIEIGLLKIAQIQQILKLSELPSVDQQQTETGQSSVNRQETPIKIEDKSVSPVVKKVNPTVVAEKPVRRLTTLKSTLVLEEDVKLASEAPQKQGVTSNLTNSSVENSTYSSFDSATIFAVLQEFS
ncbi:MAG: DNA polymerase III subunit gamma/tau, partial [Spirosomataceae bacterium]